MNPVIFEKLMEFYKNFDTHVLKVEGNVCKACQCNDECCTFAARGGKHSVSKMELEYIEHYYRQTGYPRGSVELFKEYLSRKRNPEGKVIHPVCPFFDQSEQGCTVYPARPLACRLYGSFFLEGFPVPPQCYFKNLGKTVRHGAFLDDVPLALEFFELKGEHLGTRPVRITDQTSSPFLERDLDDLPAFDMKNDPYVRACKLEWEGKFDEAIASYQEACDKYPDWSFIRSCMGTDCIMLKRYQEAIHHCSNAVAMRPTNAFYHFVLAMACELAGEVSKAVEGYKQTIKFNPDNAIAHASLANIYNNSERLTESFYHYKIAVKLDPDCVYYRFYFGTVLMKQKNLKEAEAEFRKVLELDPKLALAALHLAKIFEEQKREAEAAAMLKHYMELSQQPVAG